MILVQINKKKQFIFYRPPEEFNVKPIGNVPEVQRNVPGETAYPRIPPQLK